MVEHIPHAKILRVKRPGLYVQDMRTVTVGAEAKARMVKTLGSAKAKLYAITRMLKAYASGRYKRIPLATVATFVGAVLYFLNPVDMIPDAVVGIGYLDDAALIIAAAESALAEISAFEAWERASGNTCERG